MHIVNDWNLLYVNTDKQRVRALCGAKVVPTSVGIPGITKLRPQSWCVKCNQELSVSLYEWFNFDHDVPSSVRLMYNVIASECLRGHLAPYPYITDLKTMLDGDFPPVWSPTSRSFNNPLFVVWSTLMDRVYDPSHPDHNKGWFRHEVDTRWFTFENFIEDAPHKDLKAVYPDKAKSKVIGPDSCRYYRESPEGRIIFG